MTWAMMTMNNNTLVTNMVNSLVNSGDGVYGAMKPVELSLKKTVGKHYNRFWRFKGRYRVCKGSRASKKSKTAALWFIVNMMDYPGANLLVVRKVFRTLKDSCFTELKWAINRLGVQAHWEVKESPLEMTYVPTGQKIYFRGLDDPLKVTSITVEFGSLCWLWINIIGSH
jgi:phage terminase large subunit